MRAEEPIEPAAVVSRDSQRAEEFAERFDVPHAYTEYREMLANPEIDVIYRATPNALHVDQGEDGPRSAQLCRAIARSVVENRTVEVGVSPTSPP
jgi:shikimate 5-dehydrogenase